MAAVAAAALHREGRRSSFFDAPLVKLIDAWSGDCNRDCSALLRGEAAGALDSEQRAFGKVGLEKHLNMFESALLDSGYVSSSDR
jgi:hypothetical protein